MPNTIRKFLDLSTGHLRLTTRQSLERDNYVMASPYGFLVSVDCPPLNSTDLIACIELGRELGCTYVLFDCDAERNAALPYYGDGETAEWLA